MLFIYIFNFLARDWGNSRAKQPDWSMTTPGLKKPAVILEVAFRNESEEKLIDILSGWINYGANVALGIKIFQGRAKKFKFFLLLCGKAVFSALLMRDEAPHACPPIPLELLFGPNLVPPQLAGLILIIDLAKLRDRLLAADMED